MPNPQDIFQLLRETFHEWRKDDVSRMAAAIAYFTVFSIGPILLIATVLVGQVFGQSAVENRLADQIARFIGQDSASFIQQLIANAYQPSGGILPTVIGFIVLLVGATGVFSQLHGALNTVWEVDPESQLKKNLQARLIGFGMVVVIGLLMFVFLASSAVISSLDYYFEDIIPRTQMIIRVLSFIISLLIITVLFALIYKYLPDAHVKWSDVWIGAAFTSILFVIGTSLLGLYLGNGAVSSTYGAAGSLVVILIWVYFSSQIMLLGAEFTQVYARQYGSRIRGPRPESSMEPSNA
ncbi:MAG: YihY/virulence factor BrkB family protein [Anaerolineae bacterium]|nr:YihY/virulence factor BrkB family protein [Anaerolineae bacterium]